MRYSETESRRFGCEVFRLEADVIPDDLGSQMDAVGAAILILRLPTSNLNWPHRLTAAGLQFSPAGALVHYGGPAETSEPPRHLEFVQVLPEDSDAIGQLERLVRAVFKGYQSHYSASPEFPEDLVLDGYVEWAESYATDGDRRVYLVRRGEQWAGFGSLRLDAEDVVGVLHGVAPGSEGQGIHTEIIRHVQRVGAAIGRTHMRTSTQIQNIRAQRSWISAGLRPEQSEWTIHVKLE